MLKILATTLITFFFISLTKADPIEYEPCCSDLNRQTRGYSEIYKGPLVDAHAHLDPGTSKKFKQYMVNLINEKHITGLVLMPTPNHGRMSDASISVKDMATLYATSEGKIISLCGIDYFGTWLKNRKKVSSKKLNKYIDKLSKQLNEDWCYGVGELGIRHFEKWDGQLVLVIPFESNGLQALFSLVQDTNKIIDLHVEPMERNGKSHEKKWFEEVDKIFTRYPKLKVVFSHTAMTSSQNVRKMIESYSNAYFNIKLIMNNKKWKGLEPVNKNKIEGGFYEDWAKLFEEFPDRFMIGSDYKFGRKPHKEGAKKSKEYNWYIKSYRRALGSLEPSVARKIAYENVMELYKTKQNFEGIVR